MIGWGWMTEWTGPDGTENHVRTAAFGGNQLMTIGMPWEQHIVNTGGGPQTITHRMVGSGLATTAVMRADQFEVAGSGHPSDPAMVAMTDVSISIRGEEHRLPDVLVMRWTSRWWVQPLDVGRGPWN